MNNENVIFDTPMPKTQNFHWLKAKGIEYAQKLSGSEWTNFNNSDPGVTILDQLCYALTELGYCNDFPIEDILTQADGSINFQNQFYLPDEILTCSPVTIDDYRKLILDREPLVKNVYIELDTKLTGCYQTYLHVEVKAGEEAVETQQLVQQNVYALLMQWRNLAELFHIPIVLTAKNITLTGTVKLNNQTVPSEVLSQIQLAINHHISPPVRHYGYQDMQAMGLDSDDIFNGPHLKNGWIPTEDLKQSKSCNITINDLFAIIVKIENVKSASQLKLQIEDVFYDSITIEVHEIANVIVELTVENMNAALDLTLSQQLSFDLLKLQHSHQATKVSATTNIAPALPKGKYRNIESYYSVQNTFPPIYAIGTESLLDNKNNYRVAQSRQLKGYMMVFDQLLANQFSQLAKISTLFSFKSESTIAPKQGASYDGIPYQLFSPTYFCQPLYQIPNVKPLLLGHNTYRISITSNNEALEEMQIWERYKADPFNLYIQGLRQSMENDAQRDDRRNRMLNHLLARHGEPVEFYDDIISTARWYGSTLKTQIIIKSILLQNYKSLSYNRPKARSLFQTQKLNTLDDIAKFAQLEKDDDNTLRPSTDYGLISNGQLNLQKLEALEQLDKQDFDNYATVELKINLLLGLRQHYQLLIELLQSLIYCEQFEDLLKNTNGTHLIHELLDNDITIRVTRQWDGTKYEDHVLFSDQQVLRIKREDANAPQLEDYQAHFAQIEWLCSQRRGILLIEPLLLLEPHGLAIESLKNLNLTAEQFYLRTLLVFPSYINLFGQATFQQSLEKLSRVHLPVHIRNNIIPASFATLQKIIPAFVNWHNGLRTGIAASNDDYTILTKLLNLS
jgi:hypothetical protein